VIIQDLIKAILRKKCPVNFSDLAGIRPVSSLFGMDRGTPIDRYYIESFLGRNAELVGGQVLEVGENRYSRLYGGDRVKAFDVLAPTPGNRGATIIGDLTDLTTLPENQMDCFICTQTFNFIYDVHQAVEGAHHLLKPGGVMLATVAGLCQISRYDMDRWGDYWRFTTASLQRLLSPIFKGGVEIESFGNVMAACAFLQGIAVEDLPNAALLDAHDPDYQIVIAVTARKAP
jgi:hypothetical protein